MGSKLQQLREGPALAITGPGYRVTRKARADPRVGSWAQASGRDSVNTSEGGECLMAKPGALGAGRCPCRRNHRAEPVKGTGDRGEQGSRTLTGPRKEGSTEMGEPQGPAGREGVGAETGDQGRDGVREGSRGAERALRPTF